MCGTFFSKNIAKPLFFFTTKCILYVRFDQFNDFWFHTIVTCNHFYMAFVPTIYRIMTSSSNALLCTELLDLVSGAVKPWKNAKGTFSEAEDQQSPLTPLLIILLHPSLSYTALLSISKEPTDLQKEPTEVFFDEVSNCELKAKKKISRRHKCFLRWAKAGATKQTYSIITESLAHISHLWKTEKNSLCCALFRKRLTVIIKNWDTMKELYIRELF